MLTNSISRVSHQLLLVCLCTVIWKSADGSRPDIIDHSESYIAKSYGESLELFCTATGSPLPVITWSRLSGFMRRKPLVSNHKYNISSFKVPSGIKSTLIIDTLLEVYKQRYECRATNNNGNRTFETEVAVSMKPMAPKLEKSTVINSTSILVSWSAVKKFTTPISHYTLYYNADQKTNSVNVTATKSLDSYEHLLVGLEQFTVYVIYVSASNLDGEGEKSEKSIERTMPADPISPMLSLSGKDPVTHQTIPVELIASSENKRKIVSYQVFVENIQDKPSSKPLTLPSVYGNHSLNKSRDQIYIAANLKEDLPDNFVLGNEQWYGYHYNSRLKPLMKYRIYVRAVARDHKQRDKFVFGKANTLEVSTAFPPVPKIVVLKKSPGSLVISWEKINSNAIYYKLLLKRGDDVVLNKANVTKVPYTVEDLEEGVSYSAYLSVCSKSSCKTSTTPTAMKTSSLENEGGSKKLLIILIVAGVVVITIIVIIAVAYLVRRNKKQKERYLKSRVKTNGKKQTGSSSKASSSQENNEEIGLIETGDYDQYEVELKPIRAKCALNDNMTEIRGDWEWPKESVKVIKIIEDDQRSKICKGSVKNFKEHENGSVLMKILKESSSENMRSEFLSIIETMKKLSVHRGIINLLGCITKQDPLTILLEYVPNGDLLGYLRSTRGLHDEYYQSENSPVNDLSSVELLSFAEQIAAAMAHLERYKVIHGDLSARNVLVDRQGLCKLTNIGEKPIVFDKDTYSTKRKGCLVIKWAAVEVVFKKIRTIQSDVWSYGILLYEIATIGGCPYAGKDDQWLLDMLKHDYRLSCPDHVSEALYSVMSDCWLNEPDERPSFEKLVKVMRTLTLMNKHQDHINMTKYDGQLFSKLDDF